MVRRSTKLILFGGTFDPIHRGHLEVAAYAHKLLNLPIHLLLAPHPQLRPPCEASYEDRWSMLQLACSSSSELIPVDFEKHTVGPTHTISTLEHLRVRVRENFVWVLGSDAIANVHLWYRAPELPNWLSFFVVKRPGFLDVQPPRGFELVDDAKKVVKRPGYIYIASQSTIDFSATVIRDNRHQGKDIAHLVTQPVYDYIISKHIYQTKDSC